jgi:hypothetical protein
MRHPTNASGCEVCSAHIKDRVWAARALLLATLFPTSLALFARTR